MNLKLNIFGWIDVWYYGLVESHKYSVFTLVVFVSTK